MEKLTITSIQAPNQDWIAAALAGQSSIQEVDRGLPDAAGILLLIFIFPGDRAMGSQLALLSRTSAGSYPAPAGLPPP